MRYPLFIFAAVCFFSGGAQAQTRTSNSVGVWRGTSLCQVRPSACHDENVVYYITRVGATDSLKIDGRKVVNGVEEEMGVLSCIMSAQGAKVTCTMPQGVWRFDIVGDSLTGELRGRNNVKFRDVRTARSR